MPTEEQNTEKSWEQGLVHEDHLSTVHAVREEGLEAQYIQDNWPMRLLPPKFLSGHKFCTVFTRPSSLLTGGLAEGQGTRLAFTKMVQMFNLLSKTNTRRRVTCGLPGIAETLSTASTCSGSFHMQALYVPWSEASATTQDEGINI